MWTWAPGRGDDTTRRGHDALRQGKQFIPVFREPVDEERDLEWPLGKAREGRRALTLEIMMAFLFVW